MLIFLRDVHTFGLYMLIYEAFIRNVSGSEENASPLSIIFCGGIAGKGFFSFL